MFVQTPEIFAEVILIQRVAVISAKKPQAPTPQAHIRNRQTRKSQTPKVLTAILTLPNLT